MRLNRKDLINFSTAQARLWGSYYIWKMYAIRTEPITDILGFLAFLFLTEVLYQSIKYSFRKKEKQ